MRYTRRLALLSILLGLIFASASWTARANTASGLSVHAHDTLTITATAPGHTRLCNSSPGTAHLRQSWDPTPLPKHLKPASLFTVHGVPRTLPAGQCADLTIALTGRGASVAAAGITTTLIVSSDGAGTATVTLSAAGPPAAKPAKLLGNLGDITLQARLPFAEGAFSTEDSGSLIQGHDTVVLAYSGTAPTVKVHSFPVSNGNAVGYIDATAQPPIADSAVPLALTAHGLTQVGTYNGTMFVGTDKIPVTVIVSRDLWVLYLFVILGIALGVALKVAAQRWRYQLAMRRARDKISTSYEAARAEHLHEGVAPFRPPDKTAVTKYLTTNHDALIAYADTCLLFDPSDPAFVAVRTGLEKAVNDANAYTGGALKDALASVRTSRADIDDALAKVAATDTAAHDPAILDDVLELLHESQAPPPPAAQPQDTDGTGPIHPAHVHLEVGGASDLIDDATALAKRLGAWHTAFVDLLRLAQWADEISTGAAGDQLADVQHARQLIGSTAIELLAATSDDQITAAIGSRSIQRARQLLAQRGAERDKALPRADDLHADLHLLAQPPQPELAELDFAAAFGLQTFAATGFPGLTRIFGRVQRRITTELRYLAAAGSRLGEWLIVGVQVAIALIVATTAIWQTSYDGKAWGTPADYLVAVLAGFATSTVIDAITLGVGWIRGGLGSLAPAKE